MCDYWLPDPLFPRARKRHLQVATSFFENEFRVLLFNSRILIKRGNYIMVLTRLQFLKKEQSFSIGIQ